MINGEINAILTRFADSGWDLIAEPAAAFLAGADNKGALIAAVRQADGECGSCGCEYDALYKRFLALAEAL